MIQEPAEENRCSSHSGRSTPRVCWLGSINDEFGWLYQKISGRSPHHSKLAPHRAMSFSVDVIDSEQPWDELARQARLGVDRVVVACVNRCDYPRKQCQQFIKEFPEVPLALAMGDWWLGARRTGFGLQVPHACFNWFRWWDAWTVWLASTSHSLFGPFASMSAFVHNGIQPGDCLPTTTVVAGCITAANSWKWALNGQSQTDLFLGSTLLPNSGSDPPNTDPDLILWDDSRIPTCHGPDICLRMAREELKTLQTQFPRARLLVAWTLPRWSIIKSLIDSGIQFELLSKPFLGSFSSAALLRR